MDSYYSEPSREAFEEVCRILSTGQDLTCRHLGMIFGNRYWELMVVALCGINVNLKETDKVVINIG